MTDIGTWWEQLRTAALVGTARREPPVLPALGVTARPGASREAALLDAAALGDAVRRAGRLPDHSPPAVGEEPAPEETLPLAPPGAAQILELLLTQGPVAAAAREDLVGHWLEAAEQAGRIVPPRLLPLLLDSAPRGSGLRRAVRRVIGERGAWLAACNPLWAWALPGAESPHDLALDRITRIADLRREDPAAGLAAVRETWATDSAQDRAASLGALVVGLGPDDEELLETALDDRSRAVREEAARLLDRLPGSARAERMAARLRPLIRTSGTLRTTVEVALPDEPDAAAVRDGLREPPSGSPRRAAWLRQIVGSAPLAVWEPLGSPEKVLSRLLDAEDVVTGLREATVAQRDADWALAMLPLRWDTRLVALLDDEERDRVLARNVPAKPPLGHWADVVLGAPRPWGPRLSVAVVRALAQNADPQTVARFRPALPTALHPAALTHVERVMQSAEMPVLRQAMRDVLQYHSLHRAISEAFR